MKSVRALVPCLLLCVAAPAFGEGAPVQQSVPAANPAIDMEGYLKGPFPSKLSTASLNLSTFIALYNYGYRNVWELGPVIDVKKTKLPLEPTAKAR